MKTMKLTQRVHASAPTQLSKRATKIPTPLVMVNFFSEKLNLYSFRARIASSILRKKAGKCTTPLDYINLCFDIFLRAPSKYIGWPILPLQSKQEIQALLFMMSKQNISTMLEIGTANGGTLFLFTRVINSNAKIISLDMLGGQFGGGYESFKIPFFTNFAIENQRIFLVRDDSHSISSLSSIKSILKGQKLDFLFIDGDHTYEGVKMDFQMYSPLVRRGGSIVFHDICSGLQELVGGVSKFWNNIKYNYEYQEIICDRNQRRYGIGVLYT